MAQCGDENSTHHSKNWPELRAHRHRLINIGVAFVDQYTHFEARIRYFWRG
jgi:hypothetical protein